MAAQAPPAYPRILLIDDEPGIRRMMSLDLQGEGYEVTTAPNGDTGLEAFKRLNPDLVITDLKMPGMDGIEVLGRIKLISPETEVIVITGHGDLKLAIKSLQLDASDFITKPINDEALYIALKRAQDRLALKAELRSYTRELEQRVAQATAQVLASERLAAVGQTVSSLVHSIKNILSGLRGGSYMVQEGLDSQRPAVAGQGLGMLNRNIRRLADLVGDLLTFSKPRTPEMSPQGLRELAAEVVQNLATEAEDLGVHLELEAGGPDPWAPMERPAILDALMNLVSNAVQAAGLVTDGRAVVSLGDSDKEAWIAVADNGPGLEPEAADSIFQGFFSTKGAAGTGLGLMVSQKTANEHGGRVEFENRAPDGATFRLVLPAADPPTAAEGGGS